MQQTNNQLMQNNTRVHQVQENTSVQHTNNQAVQDKTSQDLNQQVQDNMRVDLVVLVPQVVFSIVPFLIVLSLS
jgi:hypothetical protein